MEDLDNTANPLDLKNINRTLWCKTGEWTFFSSAHKTFSNKHHILRYKIRHNKCMGIEMEQIMLSEQNELKLEINNM